MLRKTGLRSSVSKGWSGSKIGPENRRWSFVAGRLPNRVGQRL